MGQLYQKMLMEMQLRNFTPKTIEDYTRHMVWYTRYFGRSPAELGEEDIKKYLHHILVEKELSWSYVNVCYSALRFFYEKTLNRPWNVEKIPRPKTGTLLPEILSDNELIRLFAAPKMENGTDIFTIKKFLGHRSIQKHCATFMFAANISAKPRVR